MRIENITIRGEGKGEVTIQYRDNGMIVYTITTHAGIKRQEGGLWTSSVEKDDGYESDALKASKEIFEEIHGYAGNRKEVLEIKGILDRF